jgi:hypothetical protein
MPIARPIGGQPATLAPVLLFVLLWLNGCQSPAPQPAGTTGSDAGWTITGQAGSVSLRSPHESFWHKARPGARIPPGSQVVTLDGSRLEMASAGDKLTTSGPSRFTLPKSAHNGVRVRQAAGSLRYDVQSAPNRRFEVQTPHFSTVVKGTTFLIAVDRTGSEVLVDEGRVVIVDLNGQQLGELTTGQMGRRGAQPGATLEVGTGPARLLETDPSFARSTGPGAGLESSARSNSALLGMPGVTPASLDAPANEVAEPAGDLSLLARIGNALGDLAGQIRPGDAQTGGGYQLHNDRNSGGGRESDSRAQAGSWSGGSYSSGQGDAQGGYQNGNSSGNGGGGDGHSHGHGSGGNDSHGNGHGHGHGNGHGHGHDKGHGRGHDKDVGDRSGYIILERDDLAHLTA